ncbi:MAG: hypothetical protein ABJA71_09090 [Ginsengibacter sp.]
MKKDLTDQKDESIVIPDECGDSMWDEVLEQEIKACEVKQASGNTAALLKEINTVQDSRRNENKSVIDIQSPKS